MAGAERMTIEEVVRRVLREEHADVIRESVKAIARELMEAEVSELIGAELGERRPEDRATHRNGYRSRRWDTRAGEIDLQIPKLRQGSYFPSFLQPRKRSEQALVSVVQQAYVCGVSTRRVDQLVESLGLRISRSEVSRIAGLLDEQVQAFRQRRLEGRYPYVFVDAKVEKVRDGGRVARKCVVVAHAVHETGRREIIGLDVGAAETEAFRRASGCARRSASSSAACRRSPPCSRKPKTTCSPSTRSRPSTGPSSGPRIRWSASTARSAGAPTSSASSPTTRA